MNQHTINAEANFNELLIELVADESNRLRLREAVNLMSDARMSGYQEELERLNFQMEKLITDFRARNLSN